MRKPLLLLLGVLAVFNVRADTPVPATTAFTKYLLQATNAADFANRLSLSLSNGVDIPPDGITIETNNGVIRIKNGAPFAGDSVTNGTQNIPGNTNAHVSAAQAARIVRSNTVPANTVLGAPGATGTSFDAGSLVNVPAGSVTGTLGNNTTGNAATATVAIRAQTMTNGTVSGFTNFDLEVSVYPGTQYVGNARNTGAGFSDYAPIRGGSASALADTPPHGQEVWANQPYPVIGVTTGNGPGGNQFSDCESNVIGILADWRTNNVISGLTNQGVRIVMQLDSGHWSSNMLNGRLQDNRGNYPNGLTNVTRIAHTNGFELWTDFYYAPVIPPAGTTTYRVGLSGQDAYFFPIQSDPNPTDFEVPVITPDTVMGAVEDQYRRGVDGVLVQDMGTYVQYAGAENQAIRQFSYAANFPMVNQNPGTEAFWGYNYGRGHPASPSFKTNFNDHGLSLNFLIIPPFSPTLSYGANGLLVDSSWPLFNNQSGVGFALGDLRPSLPSFKYFRDKTTHPWIWGEDTPRDMSTYTYTDWKGLLSVAAIFHANALLTMPSGAAHYPTNIIFQQMITNTGFIAAHQDFLQAWPTQAYGNLSVTSTNQIWVGKVADQTKVLVAFFNESTTASTNLTLTWAMLNWASNDIVGNVTDVWTNSSRGSFTNSVTITVGPTNAELVYIQARQSFNTLNLSTVTNRTQGLVGGDGAVLTLGLGASLIAISDGVFSIGTSGASGLGTMEIHTPSSGNYKTNALEVDDDYQLGRDKTDGIFFVNGLQSGANGVRFGGVNGMYFKSTPSMTTVTNLTVWGTPTLLTSNTAPTSVTVGTTVPDGWFPVTNSAGIRLFIPGWTNH